MEKANKPGIFSKLKILILNNKAKCILHGVLKAHTLFCLVWTLIERNWLCFGYSIITLLLFMLPTLCQIILKIELPFSLEAVAMLFIWAAMVLGDVYDWYVVFPPLGYFPAHSNRLRGGSFRNRTCKCNE
ncbi:MAG: hypothetical protein J6M16_10230 [Clostridia bacterium]|nr:hypothetical protein [Clostridia bacterium]